MKKNTFWLLIAVLAVTSCKSSTESSSENTESLPATAGLGKGVLTFEEEHFDFGEIKEGEVVSHVFKFKNTGSDPVDIAAVNVSCGCTVASKPEKPVGVGQSDEIEIKFNSAGKSGVNNKTVGVMSNSKDGVNTLSFTATVVAADANAPGAETH